MALKCGSILPIKPNFYVSIFLVFATSFIDNVAGSLVIPILPEYSNYYGATTVEHGIIFSSYPFAQTLSINIENYNLGLALMGWLSDRYGRKPVLLLSLIGSSFGIIFIYLIRTLISSTMPNKMVVSGS